MHLYQILIDVPQHGWHAAFSFGSASMRDKFLRDRSERFPRTTYRAWDRPAKSVSA